MFLSAILPFVALAAPLINGFTLPNVITRSLGWRFYFSLPGWSVSYLPLLPSKKAFSQPVGKQPRKRGSFTHTQGHSPAAPIFRTAVQYIMAAHQVFSPVTFDFWFEARKLGDAIVHYADKEIEKAAATYTVVGDKINDFKTTMVHLVATTTEIAEKMRSVGVDLEKLSEKLAVELDTALEELKVEFSQPLPEDETPSQATRDKMVTSALSKVEDAIVRVTAVWGVSEDTSRTHFKELEPHVKSVLFICGETSANIVTADFNMTTHSRTSH
jgi:hypothetical protein